jgi:predicted esterase
MSQPPQPSTPAASTPAASTPAASTRAPAVQAHQFVTPRTVPWFTVGDAAGRPSTVLLVLHGLGQRAGALARHLASVADAETLLVVPEALARALPQPGAPRAGACWSTGEDFEADLTDNVTWLSAMLDQIQQRWAPKSLIAVGFSQGGMTLARWLAHAGAQGGALPIHQAWLWGASLPDALDLSHLARGLGPVELVLAVGDADPFVTPERRAALLSRLPPAGTPDAPRWRLHPYSGAHVLDAATLVEALRTVPPTTAADAHTEPASTSTRPGAQRQDSEHP